MKFWKRDSVTGINPLHGATVNGQKTRLREKKLMDVRNDYQWQADPELAKLDAAPTLDMSFSVYLLDYSTVVSHKDRRRFPLAIETLDGKHIGNCTCYDIDLKNGEAQVGIMIGDKAYWDQAYGCDAINTLVDYVYKTSGLNRLYLKTLDWNKRAQKCFSKCGFTPCGALKRDGYNFLLMEMTREQWEKAKSAPATRKRQRATK
jgi:RimJ/RimL family protein N-acetyltransferase